jgi:aminopeptidase N
MAIIFTFVTAAFVANVIVRDDETGYGPIIRSTPLRTFDYLYGRFAGAFAAAALAFASVPVGLLLGSIAPWVDPETLGRFTAAPYLYAYFVLALPYLFLSAALFFTLTTVTRSMMWTYVGVVGLMVFRSVFAVATSKPGWEHVAALGDPFGLSAYLVAAHYWTASERNVLLPSLSGDLLWSRLLWMAIAVGVLVSALPLFKLASSKGVSGPVGSKEADSEPPSRPAPGARPRFGPGAVWAQLIARTRLDAQQVFGSPAFFVLLALGAALSVINLWFATDVSTYGGRTFPVSRVMMQALNGAFTFITIIVAIYYAGELVWREREKRTHEIIEATPVPDWIFVAPKTVAIALVLIAATLVSVVVAMIMQAIKGYTGFELDKYLLWYVLPNAIDVTLLAVLAMFIQALSPHKFVGWAVMAVFLISTLVLNNLGFEDNLYQYSGTPDVPLSDMNRMGHFWVGAYWFRLYWTAFAAILLVLAYGLWRRGTEVRFLPRLRRLPGRLNGPAGVIGAVALVVFVSTGAFIFLNTHAWNPYRTKLGDEKWSADYEKAFLRYETLPQPKIAKVTLAAQIYPHQDRVDAQGRYVIQNRTAGPISVLHLRFDRDLKINSLAVDGARLQTDYPLYNYRIYRFDRPMQPGETRTLAFDTTRMQRGFRNSGNTVDIMDNGTFVADPKLVPQIGMDRSNALQDRTRRRKYGLAPELRMPKLGDPNAAQFSYVRHDSDWVTADITLTTDADQIPIAPGRKVSETVQNGRRTARFVSDSPILNYNSLQSARYQVASEPYKGVDLSVYYDPQHAWNVQRIIRGMKASLDYFQANFSPYQFHQARILEFPAPQGSFAESFANTIPWSEGIFFIADNRDPERIDMVTYVGAHEIAHQWWAHQVIGADEQGSTLLSETLAQYSAAMVMKHMYGPDMMRKFLKFELDRYLRERGGEVIEEEPIERVEGQSYIRYRKGSLVMYRLQDEIGEEAVNRALRHLTHDFAFKGAPYPTALDLVKDLREEAPADKQGLITDLFEKITLYDIKTTAASAHKRADGRYDLSVTVSAKKLYADGQGRETPAPMAETLDVGAFTVEPAKPGYGPKDVITVQRAPIHSGVQTVQLIVTRLPKFAGVDPYNKLIDRNSEDNIASVSLR